MAINEVIVTGKKYRVRFGNLWKRFSFWTKASDVEYDDGTNGESKMTSVLNSVEQNKNSISAVTTKFNALTTHVTEIKLVSSLPSDAASHPNTLYLITG